MRTVTAIFLCGLLLLNSGCVRSLHSILKKDDLISDKALVGIWVDDSGDTWAFTKKSEKVYQLVIHETRKNRYAHLEARLGKVSDQLFLSFSIDPDKNSIDSDVVGLHVLPVHTFAHVKQIQPSLQFSWPDHGWVKKHIKKNPEELKHEIIGDSYVLTSSTEDLQKFFLKHVATKGVFDNYSDLQQPGLRKPEKATDPEEDK
ncbi:MAG: hypothetical protein AAEJ04_09460 [Planctomycetota bacterium]